MEMSSILQQLKADMEAMAALGGPELEQALDRLFTPLEPVLRSRILEAVSTVVAELNAEIGEGRIETRLDGDSFSLAFMNVGEDLTRAFEEPSSVQGLDARITLRLPEALKFQIEAAAVKQGASVNTWLLRLIDRAVSTETRGRRQLRGFGQS
jgi:hypothetical protein